MPFLRSAAARDDRKVLRNVDLERADGPFGHARASRSQHLPEISVCEGNSGAAVSHYDLFAEMRVSSLQYRVWKRVMDVSLIILTSPLLAVALVTVAVVVRLTLRGPVFYRQQRIGRHGDPFTMLKFRTMKVNADHVLAEHLKANPCAHEEWKLKQKLSQDPRLTASGRFLRKTSLDELPQLWNVLRGDMSLVGPRPIVWSENAKYGERFHFYTAVVPGMTGLWQVSGRSDTSYPARVALDELYVRQWSLLCDLKILVKTPRAVYRCEGAC